MKILTDEQWVQTALRGARDHLSKFWKPTPAEMVFRAIYTVSDINHRARSRDRGGSSGSGYWPDYIHNAAEREDALRQRMIDLTAGDDPIALFGLNVQPNPQDIAGAEAIERVFRKNMVGKNQSRDWKLLHLLAVGMTTRQAGHILKISHSRAADCKSMQCCAIAKNLQHLMPAQA